MFGGVFDAKRGGVRDRVVAAIEDLDEAGVEKNSKSEAIEMIVIKPLEWLELESEEPLA